MLLVGWQEAVLYNIYDYQCSFTLPTIHVLLLNDNNQTFVV